MARVTTVIAQDASEAELGLREAEAFAMLPTL